MNIDDPAMLLTFDGNLAYVARRQHAVEQYYVEHKQGGLLSVHDNLADALMAAAKECGAAP